jgi:hypothetical protein
VTNPAASAVAPNWKPGEDVVRFSQDMTGGGGGGDGDASRGGELYALELSRWPLYRLSIVMADHGVLGGHVCNWMDSLMLFEYFVFASVTSVCSDWS